MFLPVNGLDSAQWPGHADFVSALNSASFCFADDSARDWGAGHGHLSRAAQIAFSHGWRHWQIARVWKETAPLAAFDTFMDCYALAIFNSKGVRE